MNFMQARSRHALSIFDRIARWVDVNRIVPRVLLGCYVWQMFTVGAWAMALPVMSQAQSFFVSTIYGAFPFLLNFYMQGGNAWPAPMPRPFAMQPDGISPSTLAAADAIAGPRPPGPPLTRGN